MADDVGALLDSHLEGLGRHALDHLVVFLHGATDIKAEVADPRYHMPGTVAVYEITRTFINGDYSTLTIRAEDVSLGSSQSERQPYRASATLVRASGTTENWEIPFAREVFSALGVAYRINGRL